MPARLSRLIDWSAQWTVNDEVTRMQVFTPATNTGKWSPSGRPFDAVDDADEEVRSEERAEEHDLRRDEEEHPEHARVDARALVGDRRAVMVVGRFGVRRH